MINKAIMLMAAGVLATSVAAAQMNTLDRANPKQTKTKPRTQTQTVVQSSDEVELTITAPVELKPGFIGGLSDIDGIKRAIVANTQTGFANRISDQSSLGRLRELGMDANAMRELAGRELNAPLLIERVEFVPGLDLGVADNGIITDFAGLGGYEGGDFAAGLPGKDSLSGYRTVARGSSDGNGGAWHFWGFSDGSTSLNQRVVDKNGTTVFHLIVITNAKGELVIYRADSANLEGGTQVDYARGTPPEETQSEAEREELEFIQRDHQERNGGDPNSGDEGPDDADDADDAGTDSGSGSDPDTDNGAAEDNIDQYQPADGSGSYCPLSLEICRRQMEQALASGEDVFTGMVLINPGEPDVQPDAPRMVIVTNDLLMDPSGRTKNDQLPEDGRLTQLVLPVWVNPPGPNE